MLDREAARVVVDAAGLTDPAVVDTLVRAARRRPAWPDSADALTRLGAGHELIGLSNADATDLLRMNAYAGLRWHTALSTQAVGSYKPDPAVYRLAIDCAGRHPDRMLMVAAYAPDPAGATPHFHQRDVTAGRLCYFLAVRSENKARSQKRPSFIEEARRAQIIESAIETFAELGYVQTSLARIAERAGISKGVISYHFAGKSELMEQIVEQAYRGIGEFVLPRMEEQATASGALRANIRSVAEYMRSRRAHLLALGEIFHNDRTSDGRRRYGTAFNEPVYRAREELFRRGQRSGELRSFDTRVMAVAVQAAIDAMFAYWVTYPDHDLAAHADELADLFEHATRAENPTGTAGR